MPEKTVNKSKGQSSLAPATGYADSELLETLYAVIMAMRGINATMAYTPHFNRDHIQDDAERIENAFKKIEAWKLKKPPLEERVAALEKDSHAPVNLTPAVEAIVEGTLKRHNH
jgi:hypothetical protein